MIINKVCLLCRFKVINVGISKDIGINVGISKDIIKVLFKII